MGGVGGCVRVFFQTRLKKPVGGWLEGLVHENTQKIFKHSEFVKRERERERKRERGMIDRWIDR